MKTLFVDIETSPTLGYFYGRRKLNISPDQVRMNGMILCYQAAWNDEQIFVESLRDKGVLKWNSDRDLVRSLAKLVSEADVVVGHNAQKFDLGRLKARMMTYRMKPYRPPQVFDTLKQARKIGMFEANSLDSLCRELRIGKKGRSGGYETSVACMHGDQAAWDKLLEYGKLDVDLLRQLYYIIRSHSNDHPNQNLYIDEDTTVCAVCGHDKLLSDGWRATKTLTYRRLNCAKCGHRMHERHTGLTIKKRKTIVKSG